jgi:tetratricopeptide (TPR) repeat protein
MPAAPFDIPQVFADARRHHQAGRLADAELLYRKILAAEPRHAGGLHLLGAIAHQTGREAAAAALMEQAIAIDGGVADYHFHLGNVYGRLGLPEQAVGCFRRAIALRPELAEAHSNLGYALAQLGDLEEAAACCRRAIVLRPDFPLAHYNLAAALTDLGRPGEAVACCRAALARRPDDPEALNALAIAHRQCGDLDAAMACSRRAIGLRPGFAEAHFNLALALLARGDFAAGWPEYEWRWRTPDFRGQRRNFAQPQWRGEPAAGRTLLLHAEQGFGDTLQFCRYAPLAAARGLRVTLAVPAPLVRLLRGLPGVERVVSHAEDVAGFDLHCPLLSLPLAVGTTLAGIPSATCYLRADPAQAEAMRRRLAAIGDRGPRIGVAWAGNPRAHAPGAAALDRRRSIPPERLLAIFGLPGPHIVSLQKDGPAAPGAAPMTDLMSDMSDFADTAALIANLDLVVSVDTSVAHLAAALGKPVWLLDRFDHCWRWLAGRRDSPWYPGLRIYRQPRPGDWESVLAEVGRDLRALPR